MIAQLRGDENEIKGVINIENDYKIVYVNETELSI